MSGEHRGPLKILLVEDSPSDAELFRAALLEAIPGHHAVVRAETFEEAIALTRELSFDAIMLDLTLPDSSGLDTVVRARAAWPETPVVVLTGANDEAMGLEAIQHGVQDFLVKGQTDGVLFARSLRYAVERQRSESEIRQMNRELERRVAERTMQLRQLALEFTFVEQRERRRIAEILHDNLQQLLVFSRLSIGSAHEGAIEPDLKRNLKRVERTLVEAIEVSRSLAAELSPPSLYSHGLAAAVRWFAGRLQTMAGLTVTVVADEGAEPQLEGHRVLLFQSLRELLTNVAKHAGVAEAVVRIGRSDGDGIEIAISDKGCGFDPDGEHCGRASGCFGLFGIRERLHQMGGRCEIQSQPGHGTMVTLIIPGCVSPAGTAAGDAV